MPLILAPGLCSDPSLRGPGWYSIAQSRSLAIRGAGEPAVIITRRQTHPAVVPLARDEGLAGFAQRLHRIEFLLEPLFRGFAGVDRTADGSISPRSAAG